MKILLTTDTVGGVWDHTVTLARELDSAGVEVLVAVIGEPRDERLASLPAGVQVVWRSYLLEWMPDSSTDVAAAAEWLRGVAEVWGADVVHLNQLAYATAHFGVPTVTALHSDVLSWWSEVHGCDAPSEWAEYRRCVRAGIEAADFVVTLSGYQADLLQRHFGRAADRVIHNGIAVPDDPRPRAQPVFVSVGRAWDRAKGIHVLDDAVQRMGSSAPEVHLLGETVAPHGERYSPAHLVSHGRVERAEVDAWMRCATIYVAPSLYEPFGLAPLEAALHGCALVLSDIGSFRELWKGCAAFFPPGDSAALAQVLAELRDDPARVAQLAAAARTRALRRYTADRMATEYVAVYRELIHRRAEAEPHVRPLASAS